MTRRCPNCHGRLLISPQDKLPDYTNQDIEGYTIPTPLPPPPYTEIENNYDSTIPYENRYRETEKHKGCLHFVRQDDTISSLSLEYNIPAADIRKVNKVWADHTLPARTAVWIPGYVGTSRSAEQAEDEIKKMALKRFQLLSKCIDYRQAKVYMDMSGYNIDKALRAYQDDLDWEKTHIKENRESRLK